MCLLLRIVSILFTTTLETYSIRAQAFEESEHVHVRPREVQTFQWHSRVSKLETSLLRNIRCRLGDRRRGEKESPLDAPETLERTLQQGDGSVSDGALLGPEYFISDYQRWSFVQFILNHGTVTGISIDMPFLFRRRRFLQPRFRAWIRSAAPATARKENSIKSPVAWGTSPTRCQILFIIFGATHVEIDGTRGNDVLINSIYKMKFDWGLYFGERGDSSNLIRTSWYFCDKLFYRVL